MDGAKTAHEYPVDHTHFAQDRSYYNGPDAEKGAMHGGF